MTRAELAVGPVPSCVRAGGCKTPLQWIAVTSSGAASNIPIPYLSSTAIVLQKVQEDGTLTEETVGDRIRTRFFEELRTIDSRGAVLAEILEDLARDESLDREGELIAAFKRAAEWER